MDMAGLTWDCSCGAVNDAAASSCASCGRPPADVGQAAPPRRRPLPFSAAGAGAAVPAVPAFGGDTLLAPVPSFPPVGRDGQHGEEPDPGPPPLPLTLPLRPPEGPPGEAVPGELPPAAIVEGLGDPALNGGGAAPGAAAGHAGAAEPAAPRHRRGMSSLDEPKPVAVETPGPRRSAALSVGFVVAVLALIIAVVVVLLVVTQAGTAPTPNPNHITTLPLP
jgi:hypothetical protein